MGKNATPSPHCIYSINRNESICNTAMCSSVFTPLETYPHPIKHILSIQCGVFVCLSISLFLVSHFQYLLPTPTSRPIPCQRADPDTISQLSRSFALRIIATHMIRYGDVRTKPRARIFVSARLASLMKQSFSY